MFEDLIALISFIAMTFVTLLILVLFTIYVLLAVENYTKYKPITWLIDKAMRSH